MCNDEDDDVLEKIRNVADSLNQIQAAHSQTMLALHSPTHMTAFFDQF